MKTAFVTGATGFIGAHLCAELAQNGVEVWAACRDGSPNLKRLPPEAHIVGCDMDSYDRLPELLAGIQIDVFYHLAWESASGPGRGDPALQLSNVKRTLEAVQAAAALDCAKFVATGTVYERLTPQIKAAGRCRSADFYLLGKSFARDMACQLALRQKLPFVWCTFFHPIGRYIKPEQMMAYTVACLQAGRKPAFGPAQEPYDILAVEDVAHGLYLAGLKAMPKPEYYIGSGAPKRLYEYLEETRRILKADVPLGLGERLDDGLRFDFAWYDTAPFVTETGFAPRVGFVEAVKNVAEWVGMV